MAEETIGVDLSPAEDINSDAGFQAALAEKGLGPEQELEPTGPAQDRLVDEGALPGEPQTEVPVEAGETEAEVDPVLAEYLAQHGDDPQTALEAALKERENAQSLIGRQGSELGELRQQMAHLEGRMDQQAQMGQAEPPPELVSDETLESLGNMFDERGAKASMDWLAENRPDLIEPAIQVWAEQDPFQAGRFASRYDSFLQEEEALGAQQAQGAPQADPVLAQMRAREQFTMLTEAARQQLQIPDESWAQVREHVVPAFSDDATSPLIKNAIISSDVNTQFEGMKAVVSLARERAVAAQTQAAEAQAQQESAAEAEQRKLAATVTTGSLRPAPEGKSVDEMSSEERIALFKQSLLSAPSTSILDGLTGV